MTSLLNRAKTTRDPVLEHLICPISQEIMIDPVICEDGICYDRKYIKEWFKTHRTSPNTNKTLDITDLVSNICLRNVIHALMQSDYVEETIKQTWQARKAIYDAEYAIMKEQEVTLYVKTLTGRTLTITNMSKDSSILHLYNELSNECKLKNLPGELNYLEVIWRGKLLPSIDDVQDIQRPINDFTINNKDTLYLRYKLGRITQPRIAFVYNPEDWKV